MSGRRLLATSSVVLLLVVAGCGADSGDGTAGEERTPSSDPLDYVGTTPPATYGPDGIELDPGITEVKRVRNPLDVPPPEQSVGLWLENEADVVFWVVLYEDGRGGTNSVMSLHQLYDESMGFGPFVRNQTFLTPEGGPGYQADPSRQTVFFAHDEGDLLYPQDGYTIEDQQGDLDAGPAFASADADTAVARLRGKGGRQFFGLCRREPGGPAECATVPVDSGYGGDLDTFLVSLRASYLKGGPGLL